MDTLFSTPSIFWAIKAIRGLLPRFSTFHTTFFLLFSYVWYLLIPVLLLQRLSMSTGFLAINMLLNTAADAEYMGLLNGLGMTVSSTAR